MGENIMETAAIQNAVATAVMAKAMETQSAQVAVLMMNLEQIQQLQAQIMQSLGMGTKVNLSL